MRVLLLGAGARTHALASRIAESGGEVWCMPAVESWRSNPRIHAGPLDFDLGKVARWAADAEIQLVVGLDEYSAYCDAGATFEAQNLLYFAPSRAAAELERSKLHSRWVLERLGFELPELLHVVTAPGDTVVPDSFPVVLRLDRATSAQGVRVARDPIEFADSLVALVHEHATAVVAEPFAVLVEEFVTGLEVTFAVLAGARAIVDLPPVRDYKHLDEGDRGPLTSGMGGYSPVPALGPGWEVFHRNLFARVLDYMERNGTPYVGYLNANAINVDGRWLVLEFNCHMGDPDLALLLPQVDGNIALLMHDLAVGSDVPGGIVRARPSLAISLVEAGYRRSCERASAVIAQPRWGADDVYLFTARRRGDQLFPTGGRVLLACATSQSFRDTVERAYQTAAGAQIANPTLVYRRDLGAEALT